MFPQKREGSAEEHNVVSAAHQSPWPHGEADRLGEEQLTVFPETFLFPTLTGACCPPSPGRARWVVNTAAHSRWSHSREIRAGHCLQMLAELPPRGCQPKLSREARAQHGASLVPEGPGAMRASEGIRNRAGAPGRSLSAPPDLSLQKTEPGVLLCLRAALRATSGATMCSAS